MDHELASDSTSIDVSPVTDPPSAASDTVPPNCVENSSTDTTSLIMEVNGDGNREYNDPLPENADFKCEFCGKNYVSESWLKKHQLDSTTCKQILTRRSSQDIKLQQTSKLDITLNNELKSDDEVSGKSWTLLRCPNGDCNFSSYWNQSLRKHMNTYCKFKQGIKKTADTSSSTLAKPPGPFRCIFCTLQFNSFAEYKTHVNSEHPNKYSLRSTLNSSSTESSDVVESKSTTPTTLIEIADDGEDFDNITLTKIVSSPRKCNCGQTFNDSPSFERHAKHCLTYSNSMDDDDETIKDEELDDKVEESVDISRMSITTSQLAVYHSSLIRITCKRCGRKCDTIKCLSCHVTKSKACKILYLKYIERDGNKGNPTEEIGNSVESKAPQTYRHLRSRRNWAIERLRQAKSKANDVEANEKTGNEEDEEDFVKTEEDQITTSNSYEEIRDIMERYKKLRKPFQVKCMTCKKIFGGLRPTISFANHVRGQARCREYVQRVRTLGRYPFILLKFNKAVNGDEALENDEDEETQEDKSKIKPELNQKEDKSRGVRYYCKLCPKREIKTRIALGCHLTMFHGLPPVNVQSERGELFRCQSCDKVFTTKYVYNLHRFNCDLKSPHVGVLSEAGIPLSEAEKAVKEESPKPTRNKFFFSGLYMCRLCGKKTFATPNAVKIHQKFQCIKRDLKKQGKAVRLPRNRNRQKLQRPLVRKVTLTSDWDEDKDEKDYIQQIKSEDDNTNDSDDLIKAGLKMCEACGGGPYNSIYLYMEHKRTFCKALSKGKRIDETQSTSKIDPSSSRTPMIPKAMKTITQRKPNTAKKSMRQSSPTLSQSVKSKYDDDDHITALDDEFTEDMCEEILNKHVKCSICLSEFDDIESFVKHRLTHVIPSLREPFVCEICGCHLVYLQMQQHLILHLKQFSVIKRKRALIHVKHEQPAQKRFKLDDDDDDDDEEENDSGGQQRSQRSKLGCPCCRQIFATKPQLGTHMRNCPFKYQCPHCRRNYLSKQSLNCHKELCIWARKQRSLAPKPISNCPNCSLNFKTKDELHWHQFACRKVYHSDRTSVTDDVVHRALICAVCGVVSKSYDEKRNHELLCLNSFLTAGNNHSADDIAPYEASRAGSEISIESSKSLSSDKIAEYQKAHGIKTQPKVKIVRSSDDLISKFRDQLNSQDDETKLENLKDMFMRLVRRLITDDDVLEDIMENKSTENVLQHMLKHLGHNSEHHGEISALERFRANLEVFLRNSILSKTLAKAYNRAESVDEAIYNLLQFPYKLV